MGRGTLTYRNPKFTPALIGGTAVLVFAFWRLGSLAVAAAVLVPWAVLVALMLRVRVEVDDDSLRIKNYFTAYEFSWHEVEKATPGDWGRQGPLCSVHLHSGRVIRAWGLFARSEELEGKYVREGIREINSRASHARGSNSRS